MLCFGCGNEIDAGQECLVCANQRERRNSDFERLETSLCPGCGNTIYGVGPCTVCNADRAPRRRGTQRHVLCPGCGNEINAGEQCAICASGRGGKRRRKGPEGVPLCLACEDPLEEQDWDGIAVHMCPGCQAMLFPPSALERVLNKLRDATEHIDFVEVIREFKDRYKTRRVAKTVRYKHCPVCDEMMVRRNYAGASGIILDVCGDHGHWVDQNAFSELSDWVTRGGDQLAARRGYLLL
ncbi:MAG: TFIIB-type zinc ribbon-containing protein [Planctomycetota bacterium]